MLNIKNKYLIFGFIIVVIANTIQAMDTLGNGEIKPRMLPLIELKGKLKFGPSRQDNSDILVYADEGVRDETNSILGRNVVKEGDICAPMFLHMQKNPNEAIGNGYWVRERGKSSPQDNSLNWCDDLQGTSIAQSIRTYIDSNRSYGESTKLSLQTEVIEYHKKPFPVLAVPLYWLMSRNCPDSKINKKGSYVLQPTGNPTIEIISEPYKFDIILPSDSEIKKNTTNPDDRVHIMSQVSKENIDSLDAFMRGQSNEWPKEKYSSIQGILKSLHEQRLVSCIEEDETGLVSDYAKIFDENRNGGYEAYEPLRFIDGTLICGSQFFEQNQNKIDSSIKQSHLNEYKARTNKLANNKNILNYILKSQHL